MADPLISVILPVYNGEKYLKEAVESILDQTYGNLEFIIMNDGSTDASESIILGFRDSRIIYMRQENTGIGGALRNACTLAKGTYIARMDADDISFPERFEVQAEYLENNPATVLVSSAVMYINESGEVTGRSFPYTSDSAIKKKLRSFNPICHPGVMIKADAYKRSIGYLNIQPFEDHILWLSLSGIGKLHNFRFPLLKYRILNDSVSRSISDDQTRILFTSLRNKMGKGYLTDDEIKEYHQNYYEEMNRSTCTPDEGLSAKNQSGSFVTSQNQLILYNYFKKLRIPEPGIERIICTFKNFFLYFH